ncbi:T9SS type A sorting domain-containing protein [Arcicella aquatica]|uniref:T9SS type A sorting domain-containing protein n=1 Tax=Arcicella aquatica TaxID=217141 RepID=A0ABU5QTR7_9BACT|nr:T9SS type A sorting domain-containing protein [Arcicella aquatica]MEA5260505.1 T9SS type A sorting domain-containing protein [Arcicella aquatica]
MLRSLQLSLFLMFFTFFVKGQTIGISQVSPAFGSNICLGSKVYLAYTTTGTFNQGNAFKVQIKSNYTSTWMDVVTKDSSGYLIATLPTEVTNISNSYSNYADLRIVSSSPVVTTTNYSNYIYLPANIEIVSIQKKTLFPNEPVTLTIKNNGSTPIKLLTSDSTNIQLDNSYGTNQNIVISTNKSGAYGILSASNLCGVGKSTGSVDIKIVDNSLKIMGLTKSHICKNSQVGVKVQKTGKWSTNNKFKIRIEDYYSSSKFYDFDNTESDDFMTATIGENIPNGTYRIKIVASDNNIESDFFANLLYVHNESKVELTTESTSIKYGEMQTLNATVSGYGSYYVELSDGQVYNNYYSGDYASSFTFYVSPKETTQYYIKSFVSECGNGIGKNKVSITVNKAIKTDSLKGKDYCEGATCEVKFSTNASLPVGATVKVRLSNNNYWDIRNTSQDVIGKVIKDNVVSFVIPTGMAFPFLNNTFYASVYRDDIQGITFSPNYIRVSTFPSANVDNSSESTFISFKKPQIANINISVDGGGAYEITMLDDLKYKFESSSWRTSTNLPVYVTKSGPIGIKTITNVCGTNSKGSAQYKYATIENAEYSIQVSSKKNTSVELCAGDKLDLSVLTEGKFEADNQFIVELISNYNSNNNRTLGKATVGDMQTTIPLDLPNGEYYIRIYASNPLLYSNQLKVLVRAKPTASLFSYVSGVLSLGTYINVTLNLDGGGTQLVTFKDGTSRIIETYSSSTSTEYMNMNIYKTTTFGIKSVSNVCGIGTVKSKDFTLTVLPYSIQNMLNINTNYNNNVQCLTDKVLVPFNIKGQIPSGTTFSVQIANTSDTSYTTIQTGITESPVLVSFPNKFQQSGNYNIRIVSNDNSVKSDVATANFVTVPNNLALQFNGGATVTEIDAGNGVYINSNTTQSYSYGSTLRYVIKDDKNFKTIGYSNYNYIQEYKAPAVTTTYTLASALNECGVGKVSSSVKVIIKPVIGMNFGAMNNISTCVGSTINVNLDSKGEFEADNVFKVFAIDENNIKTELLKSTKNGAYNMTFGSNLKRGSYKIQMESSNPVQTKSITTITLVNKLDMTLLGSSTINPGTEAYLILRNNDTYKPSNNSYYYDYVNYELSNGKTGIVELSSYNNQPAIYLTPLKTETFTVKSIKNTCGEGKISGSATITVNPPSSKQVNLYEYYSNTSICAGSSINVYFYTLGAFSANNKFTVQLSDNEGKLFKSLETTGISSPLVAKIPKDYMPSTGYNIRVIATDSNVTSTTNKYPWTILEGISARFDTSSYYFESNKPVSIKIKFAGTPPFTFILGSDEINAKTLTSSVNEYNLTVNPIANTSYRLFSVNNQVCGAGTILSPSTVKLELITATEELGKLGINVYPNPTTDIINIVGDDKELDIQLIDFSGKIIQEEKLRGEQKRIDMSKVSAGTYFLQIKKDGRQAVFKVLKQ